MIAWLMVATLGCGDDAPSVRDAGWDGAGGADAAAGSGGVDASINSGGGGGTGGAGGAGGAAGRSDGGVDAVGSTADSGADAASIGCVVARCLTDLMAMCPVRGACTEMRGGIGTPTRACYSNGATVISTVPMTGNPVTQVTRVDGTTLCYTIEEVGRTVVYKSPTGTTLATVMPDATVAGRGTVTCAGAAAEPYDCSPGKDPDNRKLPGTIPPSTCTPGMCM